MKIALKILSILLLAQLSFAKPIFALEANVRDEYLLDIRDDDGDICRSYITLNKKIEPNELEISLFLDLQWNLGIDKWEKILFGVKAKKYLWKYLYAAQSIQFISGEILDYAAFDVGAKSYDTTTKIGFAIPFLEYFSFNAFEEYSINLEEARGEYCESVAEIIYRPKKWLSVSTGWRHTDRIHNLDTDYASAALSFHF